MLSLLYTIALNYCTRCNNRTKEGMTWFVIKKCMSLSTTMLYIQSNSWAAGRLLQMQRLCSSNLLSNICPSRRKRWPSLNPTVKSKSPQYASGTRRCQTSPSWPWGPAPPRSCCPSSRYTPLFMIYIIIVYFIKILLSVIEVHHLIYTIYIILYYIIWSFSSSSVYPGSGRGGSSWSISFYIILY